MTVEEKIANLESIIGRMEYVSDGDFVFARHPNTFVDYLATAIELTKQLYEEYKAKVGTDPEIEAWINMAEGRFGFTRKVKFGDLVLTKDHNLVIDILKPLELALRRIEEGL